MKYLLKKSIVLLITLLILAITSLIYTLLIYNSKVETSTDTIYQVSFIIGGIVFFVYGILTSLFENKKVLLSTFLSSVIILSLIIIIKHISTDNFNNMLYIKYLTYLFLSLLGSIVTLVFKKNK